MFANEGSNRSYAIIGVPEGHHDLSHHGGDPKKHEKLQKINRFHMTQFAYLLGQAQGHSRGRRHRCSTRDDRLRQRHRRRQPPQPRQPAHPRRRQGRRHASRPAGTSSIRRSRLNNLYLSLLDRMGTPVDRLGDSTGRLPKLDG